MPNLNKILLMGRLVKDPVLSSTKTGTRICRFTLAINRRYTTPDGVQHDEVEYLDIAVMNNQSEACSQYLCKGQCAYVEGRLRSRTWTDPKTNISRKLYEVQAENVLFLDRPSGAGAASSEIHPAVERAFQRVTQNGTQPPQNASSYTTPRRPVVPPPVAPLHGDDMPPEPLPTNTPF